jgi:DNA invertase Pin-like site-specific DNA recombinase
MELWNRIIALGLRTTDKPLHGGGSLTGARNGLDAQAEREATAAPRGHQKRRSAPHSSYPAPPSMSPPANPVAPRAYSYVRFSTPAQALGDSLARQMDKAAKYAVEHGLTLDTELNLRDLGVSAYRQSNAKKGALGEFLRAVADGYVARGSYLLIENMDRLTRDQIVGATGLFLQLISDGIVVVTLTNNEVFSQERFDREPWAMHLIVAELTRANQESARKSQLVGDAKRRKKQQLIDHGLNGKPYTRQTPAWIRWDDAAKDYKLIPERAAIVREVFERTDAGDGIDRIAKDLNQRGVNTWGGRKGQRKADHWRGSYIRKILLSTAPIGTFTPHTTTHDDVTRVRRDEPMTPVENLFPKAVEDMELYWRINRRFATTSPRGRNARHEPALVLAKLADGLPAALMAEWSEEPERPFDPHEDVDDDDF